MSARDKSVGKLTLEWDARADSGMYFDQTTTFKGTTGIPRVYVPRYQCIFQEHFNGAALDTTKWNVRDVSSSGTPTNAIGDTKDGVATFTLASTNEAELYGIDFNDKLQFSSASGLVMEVGWTTSANITTSQYVVIGLASAYNATADDIANNAWFRQEAATDILVETDDGTTDDDDNDTTVNMNAGQMKDGRIEIVTPSDVRFYLGQGNLTRVLSTTTFSVGTCRLQPYAIVGKSTGTTQPVLQLDYICLWQKR